MSGWYAMKRGWLEHEMFEPEGRWSRAEAWVWMVEAAAYKPTVIDIGGKPYTVPRGAICHSLRFMATRWRWSTKAVQNFLRDLEAHGVVRSEVVKGGHGGETRRTQVSLCNYEKYQAPRNTKETQEKREGNKEEQGNKLTIPPSEEAVASPHPVSILTTTMWEVGKRYLGNERFGITNPGAVIGRFLKINNDPATVLSAIDAAHKADTHDPIPYITEILKGERHDKPSKSSEKLRAFISGAD